jgi:hypothetical protein
MLGFSFENNTTFDPLQLNCTRKEVNYFTFLQSKIWSEGDIYLALLLHETTFTNWVMHHHLHTMSSKVLCEMQALHFYKLLLLKQAFLAIFLRHNKAKKMEKACLHFQTHSLYVTWFAWMKFLKVSCIE